MRAGEFAHGVVEGQAQGFHAEVDGVAGQVALGPAPVALFEDQARMGGNCGRKPCSKIDL